MEALVLEDPPSIDGPAPASGGCVAHVLVFGFDHDVGNVLEFAYPPLEPDDPPAVGSVDVEDAAGTAAAGEVAPPVIGAPRLPSAWCHLPFQALPDGVHRELSSGTQPPPFFFTVPARSTDPSSPCKPTRATTGAPLPLHATACYRQLSTAELRARQCESPAGRQVDDRITRNAVQKSVVVLCHQPLYGLVCRYVIEAADAFAGCGFSVDEGQDIMRMLYARLNDPEAGLRPPADAIASSALEAAARLQRRRSDLSMRSPGTPAGGMTLARARSLPTSPPNAAAAAAAAVAAAAAWRPPPSTAPAFSHGSGTAALIRLIGGRAFLGLIKGALLQRRIVIYGEPAGLVSAAVLGVAACLPCTLEQLGKRETTPDDDSDAGRGEQTPGGAVGASGSWAELGLPPEVGQGWLSGGAVCGFQPHASMQALGEVLVEGDSGGRLLGCSPNVAMLLAAKIKRAQSQGAAAQNAAPSTPQKGAVAPPGSGGGGSASKMVGLPGVGVGAGDLRCDVLYSLSEKGAVTFCSAELEATLGKVSKAENAFAARLQTLVDRHESELLIADADPAGAAAGGASGGGVTPGVAARQQAAAFALETRLHTLMHSYVGGALEFSLLALCVLLLSPSVAPSTHTHLLRSTGLLVVAGADEPSFAASGGGGSGGRSGGGGGARAVSTRSELVLRHRKTWITAWQRTAAYHIWAAGLRRRNQEQAQERSGGEIGMARCWPAPELAGPDELRRAAVMSSPREAAGGTVYGAVAGAAEIGSWGVGALAAGAGGAMGGAGRWVSWAVGSGDASTSSAAPPLAGGGGRR
jgi:hypothetical protein